jgi:hypothetical protein
MKSQNVSQVQTMIKAIKVEAFSDYTLVVSLEDGRKLKLDLSYIQSESGPVVEPLKKLTGFKQVFIQDGIVTWPSGFDIDPYYVVESGVSVL